MNIHIKRLLGLPLVLIALVILLYFTQEDPTVAKNVAIISVPVILIQSFLYYRRYKKEIAEKEFIDTTSAFSRLFVDINAFFPKQQNLILRIDDEKPQSGNNGKREFFYIPHNEDTEINRKITLGTFLAADITGRENFRHLEELAIHHTFTNPGEDYRLIYDKPNKEFRVVLGKLEIQ